MSLSTCQALQPDPARVSLVDLLLEGQLQSHLRALDDGLTTEQLVDTSGTRLSSLPAITYIDSDWNICSLTYADIIEYCKLVSEQLSKLVCNASANITIWNVSTDEGESACFTIPPVLVLYGDAAQWTPLFMIAANHVSLAFYSVDKPEQLKNTFGQLPNSTLGAFICHKYRYNELNCLLADQFDGETLLKTELLQDYYLLHFPSVNCSTQKDTAVSINLEIAYLINTSGTSSSITAGKDSTQIPVPASKSIFVPHGAITQNILDFREEYSLLSNDSVFISSPFTFDPSLCDIFYSLSVYAHLVLASSTLRHSALNVRRIFRQFGITYTTVTPSFWRKLTSVGPSPSELLRSLRYLNFGGEQSLPVEEIKLSILSVNENIRVYNLYGLTEVSAWASICSLNDNLDQLNDIMGKRLKEEQYYLAFIPILGRPLRDTAVYLEDGQLVIESTQRRCLILTCEQKWIYKSKYYTGDRGHRIVESDDLTYLYFVKRNCQLDFVKINGVKCYLPFIELSIQQHFLLSKVFTVTHCTALAGDWHEMKQLIVDLVVQIQPLQGKQLSAEEVERSILQHLSSQPFAFRIRLLDKSSAASILSSNGKLDIGKLRQHLKTAMQPKTTPLVTEQCAIESTILSIIALVLGIDLEFLKSNLDKELRHLGAASMSALQICLQIEQSLFGSLNTQSVSLFETVINSDIRSIIYFVHHLATMPTSFSSHNSTVELSATLPTGTQNSINEIVPPIEDASLSAVAFSLSRHSQLRKIVQLKASPIPLPEAVSFTHQWSVFMEECVDATPLIVQNGTVTALIAASHSGLVLALDAFTIGEPYRQLWSTQLSNRIESSPIASIDGRLLYIGDYSGHLTALQTESGTIAWSYQTGDTIKCTPTIHGHLLFAASYDHNLYCWHGDTGRLAWKVNIVQSAIFSSPVIAEDARHMLCCTLNGTVALLTLLDGSIKWKKCISKCPIFSTPLLLPNIAIIGLTENAIVCLSLIDGQTLWKVPTEGPVFSSPVAFTVAGQDTASAVIIGTHGKSILCLATDNGQLLWRHNTISVMYGSPFLLGHLAVFIETNATLHLLDCTTGRAISQKSANKAKTARTEWSTLATSGQIFSSPICYRGKLFIGSRDSCLHCFQLDGIPSSP